MFHIVQDLVRQELSNIITFIILAVALGVAFYNGTKAVEGWLLENEMRHARSHAAMHTLHDDVLQKIDRLEEDLEDLEDEFTDICKSQTAATADKEDNFSQV